MNAKTTINIDSKVVSLNSSLLPKLNFFGTPALSYASITIMALFTDYLLILIDISYN